MKLRKLALLVAFGSALAGCGTPAVPTSRMVLGAGAPTYDLACGCPTPAPTPTPAPEPGDVTGGGWVPGAGGAKITFGLVAHVIPKGPSGTIEVNDHGTGLAYHGTVDAISRTGNTVTFSGTLKEGGTFVAVVTDNGEPGRDDRFCFSANGQVVAAVDTVLGDGNIQLHPTH